MTKRSTTIWITRQRNSVLVAWCCLSGMYNDCNIHWYILCMGSLGCYRASDSAHVQLWRLGVFSRQFPISWATCVCALPPKRNKKRLWQQFCYLSREIDNLWKDDQSNRSLVSNSIWVPCIVQQYASWRSIVRLHMSRIRAMYGACKIAMHNGFHGQKLYHRCNFMHFFRKDIGRLGAQLLGSRPTSKLVTITALRRVFQLTWLLALFRNGRGSVQCRSSGEVEPWCVLVRWRFSFDTTSMEVSLGLCNNASLCPKCGST